MKSFAVVLALCLVASISALNDEQKTKLREHRDACITETGVDTTKVNEAKNGQVDETDEKLACFSACLLKKIGIMNADGTFNEEVTRSKIPADVPKDKAEEVITQCKTITGDNTCDTGRKLFKCYREHKTFSVLE